MNSYTAAGIANKQGGATFGVLGEFCPQEGFFVSVEGQEKRSPILTGVTITVYLLEHRPKEGQFFGLWLSEGVWYLDITEWFLSEKEARFAGRFRQQKTIWDCSKKEAITP